MRLRELPLPPEENEFYGVAYVMWYCKTCNVMVTGMKGIYNHEERSHNGRHKS